MKRIEPKGYVQKHPRWRGGYLCYRCWQAVPKGVEHKCHLDKKVKNEIHNRHRS